MPLRPNQLTHESWLPLSTDEDINILTRYFGGFSDSIVVTYECKGDTHIDDESCIAYPIGGPQADQYITITFERQSAEKSSVQLFLKGAIEFSMRGRNENFDGIINALSIETSSPTNFNLVAKASSEGPKIITSRAATMCWRPTPA